MRTGEVKVVKLLIENQADPDTRDNNNATALEQAELCDYPAIIELLRRCRAGDE